jgi:hypothetical protein
VKLSGKKTWVVEFANVHLPLSLRQSNSSNPHIRQLRVVLAPDTHNVMTISSPWPAGITPTLAYPPAVEAAAQTSRVGRTFVALPTQPPAHSLIELLTGDKTIDWSEETKQIVAHYVIEERVNNGPKSACVWSISLRGVPMLPRRGGSSQRNQLDVMTNEFEADTGKWLGAATFPKQWGLPANRSRGPATVRGTPAVQR